MKTSTEWGFRKTAAANQFDRINQSRADFNCISAVRARATPRKRKDTDHYRWTPTTSRIRANHRTSAASPATTPTAETPTCRAHFHSKLETHYMIRERTNERTRCFWSAFAAAAAAALVAFATDWRTLPLRLGADWLQHRTTGKLGGVPTTTEQEKHAQK